jgi:hypothetical protein
MLVADDNHVCLSVCMCVRLWEWVHHIIIIIATVVIITIIVNITIGQCRVTPAPTSSMKGRDRAVSMAPGLVLPVTLQALLLGLNVSLSLSLPLSLSLSLVLVSVLISLMQRVAVRLAARHARANVVHEGPGQGRQHGPRPGVPARLRQPWQATGHVRGVTARLGSSGLAWRR